MIKKAFLWLFGCWFLLTGLAFGLSALVFLSEGEQGSTILSSLLSAAFLWAAYRCWCALKTQKTMLAESPFTIAKSNKKSNGIDGLDPHDFLIFKKLANQVIADGKIESDEALALQSFLYKNGGYEDHRTRHIIVIVDDVLADGKIDDAESRELTTVLGEFVDSIDRPASAPKPIIKNRSEPIDVSTLGLNELVGNRVFAGTIESRKDYFITYTDSKGDTTEREIFVSSIKTNKAGNDIVYARCKSAGAMRSFRLDRIDEAIDMETGELVIF